MTSINKARGADCANCPLSARRCVPSKLVKDADMIVVGEAPGIDEIVNGEPFVGQSGDVLKRTLIEIGIDPTRVAYTNAVLCQPIGADRDIPLAAIVACSARLAHDIRRVKTKRVAAAGNAALWALDYLVGVHHTGGVLARAGSTYDFVNDDLLALGVRADVTYTATVNPAYLLRADAYTPTYIRHMRQARLPRRGAFNVDKIAIDVMTASNLRQIEQYVAQFEPGSPMAFDVETDHLQWYATPALEPCDLLCLVFTFEDWRSIIVPAVMLDNARVFDTVIDWLQRYNVIGHNVKFDQNVSARPYPLGLGEPIVAHDDTMAMHHVIQEIGMHGLKELAADYLGAPDYEEYLITSWFHANGMSREASRRYSCVPVERLYKYAGIDGAVTLQLWRIFDAELRAQNLYDRPYRQTVMSLANALPIIEQTGIALDRDQLTTARVILEDEIAIIEQHMTDQIVPLVNTPADKSGGELARLMSYRVEDPTAVRPLTKKGEPTKRKQYTTALRYNPASNPQTHHVIYNVLGLKLTKRLMKETSTNTGKEAIEALPDHSFLRKLRTHRRVSKMLDTYVTGYERRMTLDNLIHIDFRLTGTEIGRLSASNSDHGIPRPGDFYGALIRSLFVASDPDEVLIIADYSQAELRAFALLAQCQFLLEKYRAGADVHTETALMLESMGAPVFRHFAEYYAAPDDTPPAHAAKEQRTLAKNVNFGGLVYMGGPNGIAGMIGGKIDPRMIADILRYYDVLMPEAKVYQQTQFEHLQRHGYVETVFGRRRRFNILTDYNLDEIKKAVVHMPVAGSAADLTNHSAVRLVDDDVRVAHTIHDSIIARARRCDARETAEHMRATMVSVGDEFMPGVPWVAEISVADRWVKTPDIDKHIAERFSGF